MRDGYFEVTRDGSLLNVKIVKDLSAKNAPALMDELSKYVGQGIEKVVFDATGLFYISSAGFRVVFYAIHNLSKQGNVTFVNCPEEIRSVLEHVGLTTIVKFEDSEEVERNFRQNMEDVGDKILEERINKRREVLDNFAAHNDVVSQNMKLGEEE